MHTVAAQLNKLKREMYASFFERQEAIDALVLGLVAGEHSFMIGPPGVAKSLIADHLVSAIEDVRYFKAALSKTRPAEAILGPLRELDEVAYLRFASVYRAFTSIEDFEAEIRALRAQTDDLTDHSHQATHEDAPGDLEPVR